MLYKNLSQWFFRQAPRLTRSFIAYHPNNVVTRSQRGLEAQFSILHCPCYALLHVSPANVQWTSLIRFYSQDTTVAGVKENLNPKGVEKKKLDKKPRVVKILLINETGNISETTLDDAQKIAKKKGLQLVEDGDHAVKSDKKVYKLETNAQHYGSDWKEHKSGTTAASNDDKVKGKKEDKTIILKSRISEHDAQAKVKQIIKLVEKGHPVRVFIGQTGSGDSDSVYKLIETNLKGSQCKIQQKVSKGGEIRFKVVLSQEETSTSAETTAESDSEGSTETAKKIKG